MTVTTRSNSQIVRNQHVQVPASPSQTPLILRGEDDHEESEDTCTRFKRYAFRKKRAFAATLYSDNSEDSPPPQTPKHKMRALAAKKPKVLILRNAGGGGLERLRESAVNEAEGEMEREEAADDMHSRQGELERDARDADASEDEEVVDEGQENGNESNQSETAYREDYEEERDEGNGDDHDNVEDNGSDGDVNQGEPSSDKEQNVEGDDSEIDVSEQDDGECHEIERSGMNTVTQDEKVPGEDYSPPQRVRFSRGKCTRTSNKTAQVTSSHCN